MKKYIWAAILLVGAMIIIYTTPRTIIRKYDGFIYVYEDEKIEGHVEVLLDGKLYPKIFSDDAFKGLIKINNEEISISSSIPGNLKVMLQGIRNKINRRPIFTISSKIENGCISTQGIFDISRDFSFLMGYTNKLREEYDSKNVVIVCPAENREEAEKILSSRKIWGN